MKPFSNRLAATAVLLLPAGLLAQTTGTSHPEALNDTISIAPAPAQHYVKPSPAVPVTPAESSGPAQSFQTIQPAQPVLLPRTQPTASSYTGDSYVPAGTEPVRLQTVKAVGSQPDFLVTDDPNSGVVMDVPSAAHELPAGSLLHTSLSEEISTIVTNPGAPFRVRLTQPVARHGEVLLPAGTSLTGRVAKIHAGNRMHGGPMIQLVPEFLTLPDGTKHRLDAQVIDLPYAGDAKVSDEGVIRGTTNLKATAAGVGLTTASATVAGAMIGGGVGAAVGATVGVGVATVWYFKHEQEQTLAPGTEIVFSLDRPLLLETGPR